MLAHCLSTSFKLWPLLARPPVGAMANAIMAQAPQVAPRCLQLFLWRTLCSAVWHSEALLGSICYAQVLSRLLACLLAPLLPFTPSLGKRAQDSHAHASCPILHCWRIAYHLRSSCGLCLPGRLSVQWQVLSWRRPCKLPPVACSCFFGGHFALQCGIQKRC